LQPAISNLKFEIPDCAGGAAGAVCGGKRPDCALRSDSGSRGL